MKDRRILITCLILFLTACLIACCISFLAGLFYFRESNYFSVFPTTGQIIKPTDEMQSQTDLPVEPTVETSITEKISPDISMGETIDPDLARQMDEIQMQVIMERGLKPTEDVNRNLYSTEQLSEKIKHDFLDDYSLEDARKEALTLAAFGLINPDFDLRSLYIDLYSEQVAGFFDIEEKEMVVVQGEGFGGVERFVYAHEYTHVLQDQNFDIQNGLQYSDEHCETDAERCSAIVALIEGDATLSQLRWFMSNASPADQAEVMEMVTKGTESPVFDSAPEFIALGLTFPYEYGYMFVDHLYSKGGWGNVDRAYQDPPVSTEQILHPNRYPDDKPIPLILPNLGEILGNDWEEIDRGVIGEWYSYLLLAKGLDERARLDENQAERAAEGWGGDAYVVYYNDDTQETVMVLNSVWDTTADADEFANAFRNYADMRFGNSSNDTWQDNDSYHEFHFDANITTWILAPNAEIATSIWQMLQP